MKRQLTAEQREQLTQVLKRLLTGKLPNNQQLTEYGYKIVEIAQLNNKGE